MNNIQPMEYRTTKPVEHACAPFHDRFLDGDAAIGETMISRVDSGNGIYAVLSCREMAFDDLREFNAWVFEVQGAVGRILASEVP